MPRPEHWASRAVSCCVWALQRCCMWRLLVQTACQHAGDGTLLVCRASPPPACTRPWRALVSRILCCLVSAPL